VSSSFSESAKNILKEEVKKTDDPDKRMRRGKKEVNYRE